MKNTSFQICNETIYPGENLSLALPLPELFSDAPMYMPIKVASGNDSGACLLLTSGMFGDQLNGAEIINRVFQSDFIKKISGTLIAAPVLNVYGLMNRSRYLPNGDNLDAAFPGSSDGTHAERMANIFVSEVFSKADVCIDLQTGFLNYSNLPQVFVNFHDKKSKALAQSFNAPVVSNMDYEKGMLRTLALENKIPFLLYEAGEAMRFDEQAIRTGVNGVLNVMEALGMISDACVTDESPITPFSSDKNIWVRAPKSGVSHTEYELGHHIKKGDALCVINNPFRTADTYTVKSPEEAIVVGKNNLPLVHEGEALFQLAVFSRMENVSSQFESWKEENLESTMV